MSFEPKKMTVSDLRRLNAEREDRLNTLRVASGVSKPDLHKMPVWVRKCVSTAVKKGLLPRFHWRGPHNGWDSLEHALRTFGRHWVDHHGRIKLADGSYALVSEPYQFLDRAKTELESFCQALGLQYEVQTDSWWNPPSTLRIVVWPK